MRLIRRRRRRPIDNQPLPAGGTRSVQLSDAESNTVTDHEALAGRTWEQLTYNGSTVISGQTTEYWTHKTATQPRDHDGGDLHAWMTGQQIQHTRTRLVGSTWQRTETRTSYDAHGRVVEVDSLGDMSKSGDEYCTRTEYADNITAWILDAVTRSETVSVDCATTPSLPDDLVSDTLTFYDGSATHGALPSRGLPTRLDVADDWNNGPVYVTTAQIDHDALGRVVSATDALQRTTTTTYTPPSGGPLTETVTVNPLAHQYITEIDPARGVSTATIEPNGRRTEMAYDGLGRLTAVWLPGRNPQFHTPNQAIRVSGA